MNSDGVRNPSSTKTRFAHRFVRALKKLSMDRASSSSSSSTVSTAERYKRYRMIRAAAYASMASSVGPKRAWARALLRKTRNRKMKRSRRPGVLKRRNQEGESMQEKSLRELVPGGEGMGFRRLLSETGHYIKCLTVQVKVMKNIIDLYSSN